ncbi:MAG: CotH kinase family protein, partial [Tannerellaceae bacterium]|nr:CotH kinase family protein [Tannerellaceae bacterium]
TSMCLMEKQSKFDIPTLENVFNPNVLPVITFEIAVDDWNEMLLNYDAAPAENFWFPGTFIFQGSDTVADQRMENIGIRVRGNTSRRRPEGSTGELHNSENPVWHQSSFAIRFDKFVDDQRFEQLDRLDLKYMREDPTRLREFYCFDLQQQAGLLTGELMSLCRFYITIIGNDGKPEPTAYFGLFKMKEHIEDDYLDARKTILGDKPKGDKRPFLWKANTGASLANWNPVAVDSDVYEQVTGNKHREEALEQLGAFIKNLVTLEGDEFVAWANETIDVPNLMKTYLINVILGNQDDYWVNSNNYNFYFNTHGKFYFISNDFDTSLGSGWNFDAGRRPLYAWGVETNPLIAKLLTVPEFRELYTQAFIDLTNPETGPFHVSKSIPRLEAWKAMIDPYVWDDTINENCDNAEAGCVIAPGGHTLQTPYEDSVAFWANPANQAYKLFTPGENNYFEVSGDPSRIEE